MITQLRRAVAMTSTPLTSADEPGSQEPTWEGIASTCACMGPGADCVCGRTEQVVRLYAEGNGGRPLTAPERAYLVASADWAGEGSVRREELEAMDDEDLAYWTLSAWTDYARSTHA